MTSKSKSTEVATTSPATQPATQPAKKPSTRSEFLRKLYLACGLIPEDTYQMKFGGGPGQTIITRSGVEKIQHHFGMSCVFQLERLDPHFAAVKCTVSWQMDGATKQLETFGSALYSPDRKAGTSISLYVLELAEKRAKSRAVLQASGAYMNGAFGEDESDSFKRYPTEMEEM